MNDLNKPSSIGSFHPENFFQKGYDFAKLIVKFPALKKAVVKNKKGLPTIDFGNPESVKLLNEAILSQYFSIEYWDIPSGYLCPPVPGRFDYLLHAADLLGKGNGGKIPKGAKIKLLDIGAGANLIFPILSRKTFGWDVIGSEVDDQAISNAQEIITRNNFQKGIEIRKQENKHKIFSDVLKSDEYIDIVVCNPPFHASELIAQAGTARKWKNLEKGKAPQSKEKKPKHLKKLNFGGKKTELIYPGGERAFIQKILEESKLIENQVFWFTTLVSKESHLGRLKRKLEKLKPKEVQVVEMSQGQKVSRFLAWTFLDKKQQKVWMKFRWGVK